MSFWGPIIYYNEPLVIYTITIYYLKIGGQINKNKYINSNWPKEHICSTWPTAADYIQANYS